MHRGQRPSSGTRRAVRRRSAEGRQASRSRGSRREELGGLATGKADVSSLEPSAVVPPRSCSGPGFLGKGGPRRPSRRRLLRTTGVAAPNRRQPSTGRAPEVTQGRAADCPPLRSPRPRSRQPRAPESWLRQVAMELGDAVHKCNCRRCTNVVDVGQIDGDPAHERHR